MQLPALGLGTAALAIPYGAPHHERAAPERADALAALKRALERGISLVDTAPVYGGAEALVGEAVAGTECLVATKLAIPAGGWDSLDDAAARDHVRASAHDSARALRRDVIDVLQVHNADPELIARGAVTAALRELRDEGAIRLTGATVYGEAAALAAVECPDLDVVQVALSALDPRPRARILPQAAAGGTAIVARSVLLRGVLSPAGAVLTGPFAPLRDAADAFRRAAGATWEELPGAAVAHALATEGVDTVLLGPRDATELDALLDGAERFAGRIPESREWSAALDERLLDPSRWPELEAAV